MSDVARLTDELALAKLGEVLERARAKMHAHRTPKNINAFKAASSKFAAKRTAFRLKYPPPEPAEGDAAATPETVGAKAGVRRR